MRLIDADALIQEIRESNEEYYFNSSAEREANFAKVDYAIDRIREALTVEERPHGEWVVKGQDIYCSMCNQESAYNAFGASKFSNFCPNCGAKMYKEDKE